jgi:uncharacterized protein YqeY
MAFLKEKIQEDLKEALKEKKEAEVLTLRMLNAAIVNKEKEKRYKTSKEKAELKEEELEKESQLNDEEVFEAIYSEAKKRKEAIFEFGKGGREDLVKKEKKELEILEKYLPEQLSEEEIKKLVSEVIAKVGAKEMKDMGKVMVELLPKTKGKAEGGLVSRIIKEQLAPPT